ncbi:hypothetical protein D3C73_1530910 [compost metagenome]
MSHENAAQWPRQVTGDEVAKASQQPQPLRHFGRKEQLAEGQGEKHEDDEIVDFQRPTQGSEAKGLVIGGGKPMRSRISRDRHWQTRIR